MPRDRRIVATRPVFPHFLLPSFKLPFTRRPSASSSSSASTSIASPISSTATTPTSSPPSHTQPPPPQRRRLSRTAPDTLRCVNCSADLALAEQIISKGFTGRYGRGILVAPPPPPAEQGLLNIRVGRNEERQLVTGWHVVADISCSACNRKLGWKYVDAKDRFQKYKIGKFILETDRVITHRSWEDAAVEDMAVIEEEEQRRCTSDYADIVFDSADEDECEDIFSGVWDAETVAKRRSQTLAAHVSQTEG